MKLFNKVAAIAVGLSLAAGVGAGIVLGKREYKEAKANVQTYQHVFTAKPSTGSNITLSGTNWNITATNLGSYNSANYAGVQIGSSKNNGSITLTSSSVWSNKITEVRLWLNLGGTSVTPSVTIGGVSAISDGTTVVKNSSAGSDYTKATKVTFTPAANSDTGVVVINVETIKAGYICAMEIDAGESGSSTPTYSVSYDANAEINVDATNLPSAHTGLEDETTQVLSATGPSRWGYTFGGWAASADSTTPITSVTIDGADITVYAIWTVDTTVKGAHASNPYSVQEARNAVDEGDHLQENFVSGKISQIDTYDATHSSITYWISDDGTTNNQLEAYSGKGLNGANFSSISDLTLGDEVVVCGTLKIYNSKYEFDFNNFLVSRIPNESAVQYDEPELVETTLAGFIGASSDAEKAKLYHFTAEVKAIPENDKYGNLTLTDGNNDLTVHGSTADSTALVWNTSSGIYAYSSRSTFLTNELTKDIVVGDTIEVKFIRYLYNDVVNAQGLIISVIPAPEPTGSGWVASEQGFTNEQVITTDDILENYIVVTFDKGTGSNDPKYYTSGTAIRTYGGNFFSIESTKENIKSINLTFGSSDGSNEITVDSGTYSNGKWTASSGTMAKKVTFTIGGTSGNRRIASISVEYYGAQEFANEFLSNTGCDSTGVNAPTISWSTYETKYNDLLFASEQTKLHDATANESGTDVEKAMARYDYIIGKYGTSAYNNFIGRTISGGAGSRAFTINSENSATAAVVVVVISAVSVTAIGGFFLLKRKPF